ncbi:hypothetical protein ACQKWADRAFT_284001 [Trichoderma austrokoningii]
MLSTYPFLPPRGIQFSRWPHEAATPAHDLLILLPSLSSPAPSSPFVAWPLLLVACCMSRAHLVKHPALPPSKTRLCLSVPSILVPLHQPLPGSVFSTYGILSTPAAACHVLIACTFYHYTLLAALLPRRGILFLFSSFFFFLSLSHPSLSYCLVQLNSFHCAEQSLHFSYRVPGGLLFLRLLTISSLPLLCTQFR